MPFLHLFGNVPGRIAFRLARHDAVHEERRAEFKNHLKTSNARSVTLPKNTLFFNHRISARRCSINSCRGSQASSSKDVNIDD
jgi:hypothetical protein